MNRGGGGGPEQRSCSSALPPVRVFILTDIRLYREGLADYLTRQERIEVVGASAADAQTCVELSRARPDVGLVQGVPIVRAVRAAAPEAKVLALGVREAEDDVVALAEAGVDGYIGVDASLKGLVDAIAQVMRGELPCPPWMVTALLRRVTVLAAAIGSQPPTASVRAERRAGPPPRLTAREFEILALIDRGCSNKQIAEQLQIEVSTVKNHVHHILEKLQVRRRGEAAAWARNHAVSRLVAVDLP